MTGGRDTLRAIVHGIVPEIAAHMNITLVGAHACILAETIASALDDVTAARVVRRMTAADTARIIELTATQLRHLFFLQVGVQLGLTLGHTGAGDSMQVFGDIYGAAFEQACPERTTELVRFPSVDDVVRDIIRAGFEYCHVTASDDGIDIQEWRRVGYCVDYDLILCTPHRAVTEGPALICTAANGVVVYEEFVEDGVAHRPGAPAIIERDAAGAVVNERFFHRGLEHVDCRMVADA